MSHVPDLGTAAAVPSRAALLDAMALNARRGHENMGPLSESHGFSPMLTPCTRLPEEFKAWDTLCEKLPALISANAVRRYCDETLPVLDASVLPPQFAHRAALIIGYGIHGHFHLGDVFAPLDFPASLIKPWRQLQSLHFERNAYILGFQEMVHCNFFFRDGKPPAPGPDIEGKCPWFTEERAEKWGEREYDPSTAVIDALDLSLNLSGTREEWMSFGPLIEFSTLGARLVSWSVRAQEAVVAKDNATLKDILHKMAVALDELSRRFGRIDPQRKAVVHVDQAIWAKTVGPVAAPIIQGQISNSGTSSPTVNLMDAFLGRALYENFVGMDCKELMEHYPVNWRLFIESLRAVDVGMYCANSADNELKGLFGNVLRMFAGECGFLGRHTLKTLGFIDIGMKLGRSQTIAGFQAGELDLKPWERIGKLLTDSQAERLEIKLGALVTKCHLARVVGLDNSTKLTPVMHVALDIRGTGIRYQAGDRIGILWEASDQLVHRSLGALRCTAADAPTVPLTQQWRESLRCRGPYIGCRTLDEIPRELDLGLFLKWAQLRPVTYEMVQKGYKACGSRELLQILASGRHSALEVSDLLAIMMRNGVNPLPGHREQNASQFFDQLDSRGIGELTLGDLMSGLCTAGYTDVEVRRWFDKADSNGDGKVTLEEFCAHDDFVEYISLAELIPPAEFRHYSIASDPATCPGELQLCIGQVHYEQHSVIDKVSPVLHDLQPTERRVGAATDYLLRKALPRALLAASEISSLDDEFDGRIPTEIARRALQQQAKMLPAEIAAVLSMAGATRTVAAAGLAPAARSFLDTVEAHRNDGRDRSIVVKHLRPPRFQLPADPCCPVIMFAGGTGIAPFRSFWQNRVASDAKGPLWLILSCGKRDGVAYQEELASLVQRGKLRVDVALSREDYIARFTCGVLEWQKVPGSRTHCDEVISREHAELASLIGEMRGKVYICGSGGFAKTVIDALEACLVDETGNSCVLEEMVATDRLQLEIFTSLAPPPSNVRQFHASELCMANIFTRDGGALLMAIEGQVYDMVKFRRIHPGGSYLCDIYCGMDATRAWRAVKHDKAPEVAAMLDLCRAGVLVTLDVKLAMDGNQMRKYSHVNRSEPEHDGDGRSDGGVARNFESAVKTSTLGVVSWYRGGWLAFVWLAVELQNTQLLAYHATWESGDITACEPGVDDGHFCSLLGKTRFLRKRSPLKGQMFVETHKRFYYLYLPSLLGGHFALMVSGTLSALSEAGNDSHGLFDIVKRLDQLVDSRCHSICDVGSELLLRAIREEAVTKGENISPRVQAVCELIRTADEELMQQLKAAAAGGLRLFESLRLGSLIGCLGSAETLGNHVLGMITSIEQYIEQVGLILTNGLGQDTIDASLDDPAVNVPGAVCIIGSSTLVLPKRGPVDLAGTAEALSGVPPTTAAAATSELAASPAHGAGQMDEPPLPKTSQSSAVCPFGHSAGNMAPPTLRKESRVSFLGDTIPALLPSRNTSREQRNSFLGDMMTASAKPLSKVNDAQSLTAEMRRRRRLPQPPA